MGYFDASACKALPPVALATVERLTHTMNDDEELPRSSLPPSDVTRRVRDERGVETALGCLPQLAART
jgi:hypothetical protein